ncbi:MAG: DegV family protein [Oscillospiraceae bacterium]|nr:DegV family protein [Oscillospiraceae bacterium]MBQ8835765.1 DegV family protein [Oscillospiraceae bacterium]
MSYQIITDSCCDFTEQQYQELGVACAPLTVLYKGESHSNFSDPAAVKAFYDELRSGVTATTSAVNPDGWAAIMEPALKNGEDVLAICFSSGLSTTYQSAVIAAKELRDAYPERTINVVDSLCAALGQGLLVWLACKKRDEGMSLSELTAWVEANKLNVCHWVTVDDLSHLKRGGRISATTAIVGTMLNIKPVIFVDNDGHLINTAKVRGRKAAIDFLAKKLGQTVTDKETVFIGHGDCPEDAATLEAMLKEQYGVKNVITGYVGPVIGAHTGPGVLVLFFMGTQR